MNYNQLSKDVNSGNIAPLYYLFGEEPYFIDKLTKQIEKEALEPHEEAFNKVVTYGSEAKGDKLLGELRSFPMMATRRLVVLKEAQKMSKGEFEKLVPYLNSPVDSTVFVIAWKGKGIDGRSKAAKSLKQKGVVFQSSKVYENKVGKVIVDMLAERKLKVKQDALQVLVTYLGTNLGLIDNEVEKMSIALTGTGKDEIDSRMVYEMINIDKDFNVFELLNAIGRRDDAKAHFIINQMSKNAKEHPPIMVVMQLFRYFNDLARLRGKGVKSASSAAQVLGKPPFIANQYFDALKRFRANEIFRNLHHTLEADLYLKGVRPTHMGNDHVLKTLVYRILN